MRNVRKNVRKLKRKERLARKNVSSVYRNSVKPLSTETPTIKKSTFVKPSSHTATVLDPVPSKFMRNARRFPALLSSARNGKKRSRVVLWSSLVRRAI